MANKTVLVVDDDLETVKLVKLYLNRDGYHVLAAHDGPDALRSAREKRPDLIVLDLMLPGLDGLEVARRLRSESEVPIIMLTARTTEQDRIAGLNLGADDYVTKPFSPRELAARVRAVLRRLPDDSFQRGPAEIKNGELVMNFAHHEAQLAGKQLNLTATEFRLLAVFVREPGRVFNRAELVGKVLGYDFDGFDRTIDVHILNLRRKLEPDLSRPRFIVNVHGVGYKYMGGNG